jgi:putative phage-type endonuclease
MTYHLVSIEQRTPAWHEWRRGGVGASDTAAILGLSPYAKREDILARKTGHVPDLSASDGTARRGVMLEPYALRAYKRRTGLSPVPACASSTRWPWLLASFDGVDWQEERPKIVEIKCPQRATHEQVCACNIPLYWIAQVQHQMMVLDVDTAHLWSWHPRAAEPGVLMVIYRDSRWEQMILEETRRFWTDVQTAMARDERTMAGAWGRSVLPTAGDAEQCIRQGGSQPDDPSQGKDERFVEDGRADGAGQ